MNCSLYYLASVKKIEVLTSWTEYSCVPPMLLSLDHPSPRCPSHLSIHPPRASPTLRSFGKETWNPGRSLQEGPPEDPGGLRGQEACLESCTAGSHACVLSHFILTLRDLMDCSPPGSSVHGDSSGKNSGVGCHFLLQGIFTPRVRTCVSCLLHWVDQNPEHSQLLLPH